MGIAQATVSRDLNAMFADDRQHATLNESMEQDDTVRYQEEKATALLELRLRIKDRRAKLLGLDAPKKIALTDAEEICGIQAKRPPRWWP